MKKILIIIFLALLLFGILSKGTVATSIPTPISTPTPNPLSVSSFELFWPIVAGKTEGNSLYFVKTLKEGLRGKLIFGSAQKADYSIFLATKRVVEAEKLILEGKSDLAEKTLIRAIGQIDKATVNVDKALANKTPFQEQAVNMNNRLSNLEIFIPNLITKADKNKESLIKILEKVVSLKAKLL